MKSAEILICGTSGSRFWCLIFNIITSLLLKLLYHIGRVVAVNEIRIFDKKHIVWYNVVMWSLLEVILYFKRFWKGYQ